MLLWRLAVRAAFVGRLYGSREALRSIPRTIIANIIAIMAARRAVMAYLRSLRGGAVAILESRREQSLRECALTFS